MTARPPACAGSILTCDMTRRVINLTDTPPGTVKQEDIDRANLVYRIEGNGVVSLIKNRFGGEGATNAVGLKDLLTRAEAFNLAADGFV